MITLLSQTTGMRVPSNSVCLDTLDTFFVSLAGLMQRTKKICYLAQPSPDLTEPDLSIFGAQATITDFLRVRDNPLGRGTL